MVWIRAVEIINLLKKQLGLEEEFFAAEKVWQKEVGMDDIEITGYKNGVIFTKTQSSVAGCELALRKKKIIKKINQYIGGSKIKDIKIKVG